MRKYVVEVNMWVPQMRPSAKESGGKEYEMTLEEARGLERNLHDKGVKIGDVRVRPVK